MVENNCSGKAIENSPQKGGTRVFRLFAGRGDLYVSLKNQSGKVIPNVTLALVLLSGMNSFETLPRKRSAPM